MDRTLESLIEELFDILLSPTQEMKSRVDKKLIEKSVKKAKELYEKDILPRLKKVLENDK